MAKLKAKYHAPDAQFIPATCANVAIPAKHAKGDNITGEMRCGFQLERQAAHHAQLILSYPECPACTLYTAVMQVITDSLPDQYINAAGATTELDRINQVLLQTHQDINAWMYAHLSPKEAVDYVVDALLWQLIIAVAGQVGLYDQTGGPA